MYGGLIFRIRYHIEKAKFMGLGEHESTKLLEEAADAIESLCKIADAYGKTMIALFDKNSNAPNALDSLETRCKFCGGKLSEIRTFGKLKVRHCYGCMFDYDENGNSYYGSVEEEDNA